MADQKRGSNTQENLARLKQLRATIGRKTGEAQPAKEEEAVASPSDVAAPVEMTSQPQLQATEQFQEPEVPISASVSEETASQEPTSQDEQEDPESLNAYFEALGFSPDESNEEAQEAKTPPLSAIDKEFSAPEETVQSADFQTVSDDAPQSGPAKADKTPGREIRPDDLWHDPVRTDDNLDAIAMGTAAIGTLGAIGGATIAGSANANVVSMDPNASSQEPAEQEPEQQEAENAFTQEETPQEPVFPDPFADGDFSFEQESTTKEAAIEAEMETAEEETTTIAAMPLEALDDDVSIEAKVAAFEAEAAISLDDPLPEIPKSAQSSDDENITVRFNAERSTLLNHVAAQMDCSADDVVITAIDWYLDALFGEDGGAQAR